MLSALLIGVPAVLASNGAVVVAYLRIARRPSQLAWDESQ